MEMGASAAWRSSLTAFAPSLYRAMPARERSSWLLPSPCQVPAAIARRCSSPSAESARQTTAPASVSIHACRPPLSKACLKCSASAPITSLGLVTSRPWGVMMVNNRSGWRRCLSTLRRTGPISPASHRSARALMAASIERFRSRRAAFCIRARSRWRRVTTASSQAARAR